MANGLVGSYGASGMPWAAGNPEYDAWARTLQASQQAANSGLGRVSSSFTQGPIGQGAQQLAFNPQGFSPEAMEAQRSRAAQNQAGAKKSQIENFRAQAATSGFGGGPEQARLEAQIGAMSAQELQNAYTELDWLNEQAKLQQQGIFAPVLANMAGLDQGQNIAYLQAQMGRQFPAIPGMTPGGQATGGAGGYKYLDPATGRVTWPGPWTQADTDAMQAERMRWQASNGGG
jgi:hypothetical protein